MILEKYMLPCLFKTVFGIDCLGCGFQRSVFLLFQGDFLAAFKMYPAVYTTLLFFGIGVLYYFNKSKNNKKALLAAAFLNVFFMLGGYYFKHFYV
ncbi:Protein of unknown function [Flavobacterium aquidurense]|uniref:DUF2752 domain-containing protein n=1 Tax=Flavobacterium frigidimaris TaxID=262320 RepID=A0ABX4BKT7_FLAFR|nr:DUF2752 domain-containing protein [Flavobacterium frigidimaris]OXA76084.1 hypothetical protein B0A65_19720 [Flavobacterium frigidimaris]SDY35565.1 Protein of unknown function [Flavobacterium aquidurense]